MSMIKRSSKHISLSLIHISLKDADYINDAIKEVGNLLVGSWDRVFREELKDHKHFKQADTFVGSIWDDQMCIRDSIKGVINLRGQVIPVLDLRSRFGMDAAEVTEQTCIIVADVSQRGRRFNAGLVLSLIHI